MPHNLTVTQELKCWLTPKIFNYRNPKGQSLSASDPGVEARAAALEEGLLSVSSPVMSEYEDGEVPPFDDLFDEMEASSVRQD